MFGVLTPAQPVKDKHLVTDDKVLPWANAYAHRMIAMFRHWSQAVSNRASWLPESLKGPIRKRKNNGNNIEAI